MRFSPPSEIREHVALRRSGAEVAEPEQRLLDFVADLILDIAQTHPRVRDLDVALWISRVALGVKK
jgi:hypothetical protein